MQDFAPSNIAVLKLRANPAERNVMGNQTRRVEAFLLGIWLKHSPLVLDLHCVPQGPRHTISRCGASLSRLYIAEAENWPECRDTLLITRQLRQRYSHRMFGRS